MNSYTMKLKSFMTLDSVIEGQKDMITCSGSKNDIEIAFKPKEKKCVITIWSNDETEDMTKEEIELMWNYKGVNQSSTMMMFAADLINACYKKGFDIKLV